MSYPVMSRQVGKEIVEALGLPGVVFSVELHFKAGEPVSAVCLLYPDEEAVRKCIAVAQRLVLVDRSETSADSGST